jgi:peptide/nickel transport system permease protein/nickel transport system permease protein
MFNHTVLGRLISNKINIISLALILTFIIAGLLAPLLAPNDPNLVNLGKKFISPCPQYPLGTDHCGRCLLSRLIYGTRISLGISMAVVLVSIGISVAVGALAGYRGGLADNFLMRLCDILLAFPGLILALAIVGMLGPGLINLMLAMVLVQWVYYARIIRGLVLGIKESDFVLAARVAGTPGPVIVVRHILPNIFPHIIVLATLDIGWVILNISGMSFLGLGVQPPTAEWGAMLNDGRQFIRSNPYLMVYPGMLIMLLVMACNLFGDALRDALDSGNSWEGFI